MGRILHLFCNMERDGEKLKQLLDDNGIGYQSFADKMGKHRNTITRWFTTHPLPNDILLKAQDVLGISVEEYIPRIQKPKSQAGPINEAQGPSAPDGANSASAVQDCLAQIAIWQTRAYENLDKYNKLLEGHNKMLRRQLQSGASSEHAQRVPELSHV